MNQNERMFSSGNGSLTMYVRLENGMYTKIRAQYIAHLKNTETIGERDLFDVYLVLYVLEHNIKGIQEIQVPFQWLNEIGGFEPVEAGRIDTLSDLLGVKRTPENIAGRIITGLTPDGVRFLKEHVKELTNELPLFSLTEEMITNLDLSEGESR